MKTAAIVIAASLLIGAAGITAADAASTAALPAGTHVSQMTYQPGARLPMTHLPHPSPVNASFTSGNWSGYADVACSTCAVRYAATSFTLPSVNCGKSPDGSYAALWVGLDGWNDSTVEQTGIDAFCSSGMPGYDAWYEMYPLPPVVFTGVNPGDAISVSVYYNAGTRQWQLGLTDLTTGGFINTSQPCPAGSVCRNASAEVITEAPYSNGTLPLADFAQSGYQNIQVTSRSGTRGNMASNGIWIADSLSMVGSGGNSLAVPGPVYGGQAFMDTWHASQ